MGKIRMAEIEKIEKETRAIYWLPLPMETLKAQDLKIGDWVLIRPSNDGLSIEKVKTEQITIKIETGLVEKALTFRDVEGYYTLEEALSNLILKGLAHLYGERGKEDKAEKIENSWLVQIHSS